jgi:hypothetical protein
MSKLLRKLLLFTSVALKLLTRKKVTMWGHIDEDLHPAHACCHSASSDAVLLLRVLRETRWH